MSVDLKKLLPQNKTDVDRAQRLIEMGYPKIEPLLRELLEWTRDSNWPVAAPILKFMADLRGDAVPCVRDALNSSDNDWKYTLLVYVVAKWPPEVVGELEKEIVSLAMASDNSEADIESLKILASKEIKNPDWIHQWVTHKKRGLQARIGELDQCLREALNKSLP